MSNQEGSVGNDKPINLTKKVVGNEIPSTEEGEGNDKPKTEILEVEDSFEVSIQM